MSLMAGRGFPSTHNHYALTSYAATRTVIDLEACKSVNLNSGSCMVIIV